MLTFSGKLFKRALILKCGGQAYAKDFMKTYSKGFSRISVGKRDDSIFTNFIVQLTSGLLLKYCALSLDLTHHFQLSL